MTPAALSLSPSPPLASSSKVPNIPAVPVVGGSGARVPTQFLDDKGGFSRHRSSPASQHNSNGKGNGNSNGNGNHNGNNGSHKHESPSIDLTGDDIDDFTLVEARGPHVSQDPNEQVCIGLVNAVVLTMLGLPESFHSTNPSKLSEHNAHPKWNSADWPTGSGFYLEPGYRPVQLVPRGGGAPRSVPGEKAEIQVHEIVPPMDVRAQLEGTGRPIPAGPQLKNSSFGTLADKYTRGLHALLLRRMVNVSARCRIVAPNSGQVSEARARV